MEARELHKRISEQTGVPAYIVKKVLDGAAPVVAETVARGGEVKMGKLGKFALGSKAARSVVLNGHTYNVRGTKTVRFIVNPTLKEIVKNA